MVYLDKTLKLNIKDFSLVRDYVIKEILSKNPNIYKDILIMLIKEVIKLDNNTIITYENTELGKSNYKEYNKTVDLYVKLNDNIYIELECNTSVYERVKLRNILYLNKISTKILESGKKPSKLNNIYLIQININTSIYDNLYGYEIYNYIGKKTGKNLTKFQNIIVYNIEYYRNLFYTKNIKLKKYEMWLVVFTSRNFKELYNTLNYVVNKKNKNKLIKDVVDMFNDGFSIHNWEREKMIELVKATERDYIRDEAIQFGIEQGMERGIEQGRDEGRYEGIQETTLNTVINMLNKNFSHEIISEITNKSIKEIKDIEKTLV